MRAIALSAMVVAMLATGGSTLSAVPARVVLVDRPFRCADYPQPLALDLVKVTLGPDYAGAVGDAVNLNHGTCTGLIRRVEVDTWIGDGIKIGSSAHDLTVAGGYVYCHDHKPLRHQDGVQALGGMRVSLQNLHVYCPSSNNASFFLTAGASGSPEPKEGDWPTDITCENCQLDGGAQTVFIAKSIRSGIRNSLVRAGRFHAIRVGAAVRPVVDGIVELPCAASCREESRRTWLSGPTGSAGRRSSSSCRVDSRRARFHAPATCGARQMSAREPARQHRARASRAPSSASAGANAS